MTLHSSTDYETYTEIMDELTRPILADGLDVDTLKSLYESKMVYLENLRIKCFMEMNDQNKGFFSVEDYLLIQRAVSDTKAHIRDLVLFAVTSSLDSRKIG